MAAEGELRCSVSTGRPGTSSGDYTVRSLRVLARFSLSPGETSSLHDTLVCGRSLEPGLPIGRIPGAPLPRPPSGGERSAASWSARSTMAGPWVGTVAQLAARRHWRWFPQQLLWTLKVSGTGLAWAWLPELTRRHPRRVPAVPRPGPSRLSSVCIRARHPWENAPPRGC